MTSSNCSIFHFLETIRTVEYKTQLTFKAYINKFSDITTLLCSGFLRPIRPTVSSIVNTRPSVTLYGCFFTIVWCKLQQSDLVPEYEVDDSPVRTYFKMMCALPFVPEDIMPTAWRHLKPHIPSEMSSFVDCYEYT